jgi:hypothetical protein
MGYYFSLVFKPKVILAELGGKFSAPVRPFMCNEKSIFISIDNFIRLKCRPEIAMKMHIPNLLGKQVLKTGILSRSLNVNKN